MEKENRYYNYILLDPRKPLNWEYQGIKFEFSPFYVGKGTGDRCKHHYTRFSGENPHKENIIKVLNNGGYFPMIKILNNNSEENYTLKQEIEIIKWIKSNLGEVLTNILEGGDNPPHYFGKDNPKARKVYQYDKDTGELLNEFDCMCDAMRFLGQTEQKSVSHISDCCSGKRRTFATYKWSYEKLDKIAPNTGKYDRIKFKKLIAYNDEHELEFTSMKEAYTYFNDTNKGKINSVLKGERKTYKGYHWKIEN